MEELTERQREILSFIVKETETRGFPPTIREIGEQTGFDVAALFVTALERECPLPV